MMCGNCGCMRADSQCPWTRTDVHEFLHVDLVYAVGGYRFSCPVLMSIFMHLQDRQAPPDFRGPSQKLLPLLRLAKLALIISIQKNPVSRKWLNQKGH